jgi:transcriptional regulator with XRE-family HTH domain
MDNELPPQWADRLIARGFTDRRSATARASLSALADATGLHVSTLSSTINGKRHPSMGTVTRLVEALGADVAQWLGLPALKPWTPPPAAALLTERQRRAIDALILAMTEHPAGEGHEPTASNPDDDLGEPR